MINERQTFSSLEECPLFIVMAFPVWRRPPIQMNRPHQQALLWHYCMLAYNDALLIAAANRNMIDEPAHRHTLSVDIRERWHHSGRAVGSPPLSRHSAFTEWSETAEMTFEGRTDSSFLITLSFYYPLKTFQWLERILVIIKYGEVNCNVLMTYIKMKLENFNHGRNWTPLQHIRFEKPLQFCPTGLE